MHKNALFFEKKTRKSPQRCGLRSQTPEWLLPSPGIVIFSKAFVALTSLVTVKKNWKELRNSNNVLFCRSFLTSNSAQGTRANATGTDFYHACVTISGPISKLALPWLKPLVTPLITSKE